MFPYENLEVYKKAFALNSNIYRFLRGTKTQLGRASLSIMLNIAEGSSRVSLKDRRNFFVMARGSVFECSAIIEFLYSENEIMAKEREDFKNTYEEISKILYIMIKNLETKLDKR